MRYRSDRHRSLLGGVVRALGPRALITWALLLVVGLSITAGLRTAVPSLESAFIVSVAVVGMTLGWLLALLPMNAWLASALSLIFGMEYLLIRVGGLGDSLVDIGRAAARLGWQIFEWYWTEQPPDWMPLPTLFLELWTDMGTLLERTFAWLATLLSTGGGYDVVGIALVWGFGVWLYDVWAGFVVRRHHKPLLGVLPGSLLLSFVLSYTGTNPYILLPVLGATLLLMAMMGQRAREDGWARRGVDFSQGLFSDVAAVATGISIALVLAAAIAPSVSVEKIADWVREVTDRGEETRTEAVAEALGLEQQPVPRAVRPISAIQSTDLPQRHLIGSGPELSRLVVMVVETGELPPLPEELLQEEAPRHYWRSLTYDYYFGRGWATSNTEIIHYQPGEQVTDLQADYLRPLRQTVRLVGDEAGGIVHVDGTLVSVDQEFGVAWRWPDELFAATTLARSYRADSLVPAVTEEQLREALLDYPEWILARYLQLPESLPERVKALARDLTATEPTPYGRALAIEQYLREFEYTLDVPMPGASEDIADFFLFELQKGYCDYYATSMVVLARAAGLPARLVVGYVNGSYDPMDARYVVTEADAHAWPEVYFPGYGWIEFEPTGGRPPIRRSSSQEDLMWPETSPGPLVPLTDEGPPRFVFGQWLLMGVGGVLLVIGVGTGIDSAGLLLRTSEGLVKRLQKRLKAHSRRLRVASRRGDTPNEMADSFEVRLKIISESHGFSGVELVEPAIDEVRSLIALYVQTWYSPDLKLSPTQRRSAVWTWWRLRWRLWLAWLWRRSGRKNPEPLSDAEGGPSGPQVAAGRGSEP